MRPNHSSEEAGRPAFAAAALESRRSPDRKLLVVVDATTSEIDLKLIDDELVARGTGPCTLRAPDRSSATACARVTVHYTTGEWSNRAPSEVNLAVTWAVVGDRQGIALDVAGTAFMFHPDELRPEEFRARRRDPFNTLDQPVRDRPPDHKGQHGLDHRLAPERRHRGWPSPSRLPFPLPGPQPRWAFIGSDARRS